MAILLGVRPGGRNSFAVAALFWTGRLPGRLVLIKSHSGVQAVLNTIIGLVGEWGELTTVAVDAPLSWTGSATGWRPCDEAIRQLVPAGLPRTWVRSPNALPGAVGIQGTALTWTLALEAKEGNIPLHTAVETNARISMARCLRQAHGAISAYRHRATKAPARSLHVQSLTSQLVDAGTIVLEGSPPRSVEELDAVVSAVVAMAVAFPECGLVTHSFAGGNIRPVGSRSVVVLDALP